MRTPPQDSAAGTSCSATSQSTAPPLTGPELRAEHRRQAALGGEVLARTDLDAPSRWWPPLAVFDAPRLETAREALLRVVDETGVHAGHLDIAREIIDGHQELVVDESSPMTMNGPRTRLDH